MKTHGGAVDSKMAPQPSRPCSVVIVDDDDFFRTKIEGWLSQNSRFVYVGSYRDGETALERICSQKPDLALVDIGLPGIKGDEVIWRAKDRVPSAKFIAISGIPDDSVVFDAFDARADGFLDKDHLDQTGFFLQVQEVLRGGFPLSERARRLVARKFQECRPHPAIASLLTQREREVVELLCLGLSEGAVARKLGIDIDTVHTHTKRIYEQLNTHTRSELQIKLCGCNRR